MQQFVVLFAKTGYLAFIQPEWFAYETFDAITVDSVFYSFFRNADQNGNAGLRMIVSGDRQLNYSQRKWYEWLSVFEQMIYISF